MCVNEVKRIGTESVLNFLIENKDIVNNYFVYVKIIEKMQYNKL